MDITPAQLRQSAAAMRSEAAAIKTAAQYCDDRKVYREEMEQAQDMLAMAAEQEGRANVMEQNGEAAT